MVSSKRKGDTFERAVVDVLRRNGHPFAERGLRLGARDDRGDIDGVRGHLIECKDCRRHELAVWLDEAKREAEPYDVIPVLVVKRAGAPIERAYVVMELATWARRESVR